MYFRDVALALLLLANGLVQTTDGADHHTLRFHYPQSRAPRSAYALAIAPDGNELALCVEPETVHFIRTADGEQISQISAHPFAMRYSKDGSRLLMVSTTAMPRSFA
jgi:hypothetical protein